MKGRGLAALAWASTLDLFDQATAFGRLALVHVVMTAGDTLVTISLAGSLFFSVSPHEAKGRVLLYLLLTIAPFAVVSPLLGPLIDRSPNGRRIVVALSGGSRAAFCFEMASHLTSLWLFPYAFLVLVSSKLYAVTRGTLVPEMARSDQVRQSGAGLDGAGWPTRPGKATSGFAGFNAQLTLLGTVGGLLAGAVGAAVLKSLGAPAVLYLATIVFLGSTVASLRLQRPNARTASAPGRLTQEEKDRHLLTPLGESDVVWSLSAAALMRCAVGFATFLLAFGLRRAHAGLGLFALALSASGAGSLLGLAFVSRVRERWADTTLLAASLIVTGLGAWFASYQATVAIQLGLVALLGLCAAVAQPSFDSLTQRLVAPGAQGRTFARFAVRQQLLWVVGALVPVAMTLSFRDGDRGLGIVMVAGGLVYVVGRRFRRPPVA